MLNNTIERIFKINILQTKKMMITLNVPLINNRYYEIIVTKE